MEILIAAAGGVFIVYLLAKRGGSCSTSSCSGLSTTASGAPLQFLQPSGSPAGLDVSPVQLSKPAIFNQTRVRPDGPMYIYPVSNVGQGTIKQARVLPRAKLGVNRGY